MLKSFLVTEDVVFKTIVDDDDNDWGEDGVDNIVIDLGGDGVLNPSKAFESSSSLVISVLIESCSDSMWLSVSVPE